MDLSKIDRRTWLLIALGLFLLTSLDLGSSGTKPLKQEGLRVLMIYETADKPTPILTAIRDSAKTRSLLEAKCVKEDGAACFRFLDDDTDLTDAPQWVVDGMKLERKSLPWLIVSGPSGGYSGPLPASLDEFVSLVEKAAK